MCQSELTRRAAITRGAQSLLGAVVLGGFGRAISAAPTGIPPVEVVPGLLVHPRAAWAMRAA